MAKRLCSVCGEEKDMAGGKICERGHFICRQCQRSLSKCPLDGTRLS
jgi:hypothetical protein